jgi:hypothetical protein
MPRRLKHSRNFVKVIPDITTSLALTLLFIFIWSRTVSTSDFLIFRFANVWVALGALSLSLLTRAWFRERFNQGLLRETTN